MKKSSKSLFEIHIAVLLFGLSGLFGKFLDLPAMIIVLGRVFFSSLFLALVLLIFKKSLRLKKRAHYFHLILMGLVLAIHWSTFFKSIQMSTVAVGLLTFSTFPVFVTFMEPYFFKETLKLTDIVVALITFLGVLLVIPGFSLNNSITQGALWGVISGFSYAVLSILNKKYVHDYSSLVIAFYEQLVAAILLFPFLFIQSPDLHPNHILLLILLGTLFTGISHTLFIGGLKHIKTQTAGIISCLEPVYGIIFAAFLLGEWPSIREYIGGSIILGTVFYSTIRSK